MLYEPTGQRAGASDVEVSIGMLSARFDLVPTGRPNKVSDGQVRMVCPDPSHGTPVRVEQRYHCPDGHSTLPADTLRARETDDGLVYVDKDAVAAAKTGGKDTGVLDLSVFPAAQVDGEVLPAGLTYRLRPAKVKKKVTDNSVKMYGAWRDLVKARPDVVLMGRLLLRGQLGLWRLGVWGDQLILEQVVHPADLAERDTIDVPSASTDKLSTFVDAHLEEWDPDAVAFDVKAAVDAVVAQAEGRPEGVSAPVADDFDLDALLEKAMAAKAA